MCCGHVPPLPPPPPFLFIFFLFEQLCLSPNGYKVNINTEFSPTLKNSGRRYPRRKNKNCNQKSSLRFSVQFWSVLSCVATGTCTYSSPSTEYSNTPSVLHKPLCHSCILSVAAATSFQTFKIHSQFDCFLPNECLLLA